MAEFRLPLDYKEKVGRAIHELPTVKRTTALPGVAIPLYGRRMKRGESFIFSTPQMLLQSLPTLAPVLGGWRLRIEWYFNSDANHYGWIDNNSRLTPDEVLTRRHHTFRPNMPGITTIKEGFESEDFYSDISECDSYYKFLQKFGVGKGSLMDFMGVAPGTIPNDTFLAPGNTELTSCYNLDFILTYLNIIRCYHVNQQFPDIPYIKRGFNVDTTDSDNIQNFGTLSQKDLDNFFMWLRYCSNGVDIRTVDTQEDRYNFINYTSDLSLNSFSSQIDDFISDDVPLKYRESVNNVINYLRCVHRENSGLFCCQYMPDLYRNLLNSDADLLKSEVHVNMDGSFSIETFRFQNRLQLIYDRIQPFGGKDSTLARTRWGIKSNRDYDIPELLNVHTEFIDTSAITSTNAGTASSPDSDEVITTVPGELSGTTNQRRFSKGAQKFTANSPGTLMAIVTLVPQVDYCQNTEPYLTNFNFEDEFSPQMAQRGFESVPQLWYSSLPTVNWWLRTTDEWSSSEFNFFELANEGEQVIGKQVAWLNDIASTNRVHGEFSRFGELDYWVLSRNFMQLHSRSYRDPENYEEQNKIYNTAFEYSPYVNPLDWQYMFVAQTLNDPNWYLQVMFDVKDISPVGYRFMPTLE